MFTIETVKLHYLSLSARAALVNVLRIELNRHFVNVDVNWVTCPDLSKEPFNLPARGICGNTAIIDIGDKSYIEPSPMLEKKHNIKHILNCFERDLNRDSFIFGCGFSERSNGTLNELVMNVSFPVVDGEMQMINKSRFVFVNSTEKKCEVEMSNLNVEPTCIAHGSFFFSESSIEGRVLKVSAKKLRSDENLVPAHELYARSINSALQQMFSSNVVVLGGVYVLRNLEWRLDNLQNNGNDEEVASSDLCTINVPEPLIAIFHSAKNSDQLQTSRVQMNFGTHSFFRCLSHCNEPHFCRETTEDGVEILGYFCPANTLYRIDEPRDS